MTGKGKSWHCLECDKEFEQGKKVPIPDNGRIVEVDACPFCYSANVTQIVTRSSKRSK